MTDLTHTDAAEEKIGRILDELAGRIREGEEVDLSAYARKHPEYATQIRRLGPTLQAIAAMDQPVGGRDMARTEASAPVAPLGTSQQQLGDYRILREVGRGGMGVVYEAEQVSLRRQVALKVLPFAAVLDPRQVARFKNEALAAAQLHHPHIVEVFAVGCERSVHFYAMRFIDGLTLAQVIGQIRDGRPELPAASARSLVSPASREQSSEAIPQQSPGEYPVAPTQILGALSTDGSVTSREFFRSVALLGRKVAQALDYAHQQGIVHRDIKPGNIMVDAEGEPWVTDFGLAHIESGVSLTLSGDVLGTLRYASPEQALGKRGVIDHRTDIYSLGITLYELLTQRPAFPGTDRQQLLQRIASEDPPPPREINPGVPVDLETIALKATAKQPQERYETAHDLACDLQRYLAHEPIKARRPTLPQRISKWALRHTALVWSAAAILLVGTIALGISTALILAAYQREGTAHEQSLANFVEAQRQKGEVQRQMQLVQVERDRADQRALDARRTAYVTDMRFAYQQWEARDFADVRRLLHEQVPREGEADLRGIEWQLANTSLQDEYPVIGRHDGPVRDIDVFPDGHTFATSGEDGVVRIWDADTLTLVREFRLQDKPIYTVGVSPDGRWLAYGAGSRDSPELKPVTIIDAVTGAFLGETNRHDTTIRQIRFSPDGRYLASGSLAEKLSVWEFVEGVNGRSFDLSGPYDPADNLGLQFVDDVQLLSESPNRKGMTLWNVETRAVLRNYSSGRDSPTVIAPVWNQEHQLVVYLAHVKAWRTRLVDARNGELLTTIYTDHDFGECLDVSPTGNAICVGYHSGTFETFRLKADGTTPGRQVEVSSERRARVGEGPINRVRYLDDGRIVLAGADGTITIVGGCYKETSERLERLNLVKRRGKPQIHELMASPDNALLAVADREGAVSIVDHGTLKTLAKSKPFPEPATQLAWSGDGTHLAAMTDTGEFCCWRLEGASLHQCLHGALPETSFGRGLALSRSGSILYMGDRDAIQPDGLDGIHIWDVRAQRRESLLPTIEEPATILISPDDRLLVTALEGIAVYDRHTHQLKHELRTGGRCCTLLFAPNGQTLVAGYKDGSIRIWEPATGQLLRTLSNFDREDRPIQALCFSSDGQTLFAGDSIGGLRFWNAINWGYFGHIDRPFCIEFLGQTPDGRFLEIGRRRWTGKASWIALHPIFLSQGAESQPAQPGCSGPSSVCHTLSTEARAVDDVIDVDGDRDLDVLSASREDDRVACCENNGSLPETPENCSDE